MKTVLEAISYLEDVEDTTVPPHYVQHVPDMEDALQGIPDDLLESLVSGDEAIGEYLARLHPGIRYLIDMLDEMGA